MEYRVVSLDGYSDEGIEDEVNSWASWGWELIQMNTAYLFDKRMTKCVFRLAPERNVTNMDEHPYFSENLTSSDYGALSIQRLRRDVVAETQEMIEAQGLGKT